MTLYRQTLLLTSRRRQGGSHTAGPHADCFAVWHDSCRVLQCIFCAITRCGMPCTGKRTAEACLLYEIESGRVHGAVHEQGSVRAVWTTEPTLLPRCASARFHPKAPPGTAQSAVPCAYVHAHAMWLHRSRRIRAALCRRKRRSSTMLERRSRFAAGVPAIRAIRRTGELADVSCVRGLRRALLPGWL